MPPLLIQWFQKNRQFNINNANKRAENQSRKGRRGWSNFRSAIRRLCGGIRSWLEIIKTSFTNASAPKYKLPKTRQIHAANSKARRNFQASSKRICNLKCSKFWHCWWVIHVREKTRQAEVSGKKNHRSRRTHQRRIKIELVITCIRKLYVPIYSSFLTFLLSKKTLYRPR